MDEQLKPILKDNGNEEQTKKIEKPELPEIKVDNKKDIINSLPDWSIEPPIEINRGQ